MVVHFISDLHLSDDRPGITRILLDYLKQIAPSSDGLYLLGDIFEYWLGDDASMPRYQAVCDALRVLSESTPIYFMRGNRDFLVGDTFTDYTGATRLPDPCVIDLNGQPTLISHGDLFCTDDVSHQNFRRFAHDPDNQAQILALPIEQREEIARGLRQLSKSNNALKAADIMDVNQQAIEEAMQANEVSHLIHGHTHRPATHEFDLNGQPATRIVLSDWHEDAGAVLVCSDGACLEQRLD